MSDGPVENWDERDKNRPEHDACKASFFLAKIPRQVRMLECV